MSPRAGEGCHGESGWRLPRSEGAGTSWRVEPCCLHSIFMSLNAKSQEFHTTIYCITI